MQTIQGVQVSERATEASVALDESDEEIGAIHKDLEHDLHLFGATAMEDKL
jgi:phospholipid-translocating ATPase